MVIGETCKLLCLLFHFLFLIYLNSHWLSWGLLLEQRGCGRTLLFQRTRKGRERCGTLLYLWLNGFLHGTLLLLFVWGAIGAECPDDLTFFIVVLDHARFLQWLLTLRGFQNLLLDSWFGYCESGCRLSLFPLRLRDIRLHSCNLLLSIANLVLHLIYPLLIRRNLSNPDLIILFFIIPLIALLHSGSSLRIELRPHIPSNLTFNATVVFPRAAANISLLLSAPLHIINAAFEHFGSHERGDVGRVDAILFAEVRYLTSKLECGLRCVLFLQSWSLPHYDRIWHLIK